MQTISQFKFFDAHFHIIDKRFPLVANQGYLPEYFTAADYGERMRSYNLIGGAVVSGSFQGFDQTYLHTTLKELGPGFVGVTQLPVSVSNEELVELDKAGVRAVRFNLKRGGCESVENLEGVAKRVYETVGWHTELYVDSKELSELYKVLIRLPAVSVDHLGLSRVGFADLLRLVEKGIHVKATGFSRTDFDVKMALKEIVSVNPSALMFGTDLPSTRAPKSYSYDDFIIVIDAIGEEAATKVFYDNAVSFYRL